MQGVNNTYFMQDAFHLPHHTILFVGAVLGMGVGMNFTASQLRVGPVALNNPARDLIKGETSRLQPQLAQQRYRAMCPSVKSHVLLPEQ